MDFLKEVINDPDVIANIEFVYDPVVIKSAISKKTNIINNIKDLESIGVTNIADVLVTNIEPLFLDNVLFKEMISKYSVYELKEKINHDARNIDMLYYK